MSEATTTTDPSVTAPQVVVRCKAIQMITQQLRREGKSIGFVPTMGALHEGHLSLVDAARKECEEVIVSIFVNPTQFDEPHDLNDYPRDLQRDVELLAERGCDFVFAPSPEEMYNPQHSTFVAVGGVAEPLEGVHRSGHFRGVATVVLKLFQIIPADRADCCRKDYQQCLVVKQMVRDLNVAIDIVDCPIVREEDGLAMSSRNAHLSDAERRKALAIPACWPIADQMIREGQRNADAYRTRLRGHLQEAGLTVDYVELVAQETVTPVEEITDATVIVVAARVGSTRLIDNYTISPIAS